MQPEVTFNQEKNGIEIRYSQKPLAQVRTELYNMGFRYHRGKKYWYAPVTEARIVFAKQLQQTPDVTPEPETPQASFEPTPENISAGNFSYVTFAAKGEGKKTMLEDYIVFEPVKAKAEALAKQFAEERYGARLKEITIHPRNYKRKARELFQHGQIIGAPLQQAEADTSITKDGNQYEASPLEQPERPVFELEKENEDQRDVANGEESPEISDQLTNEHGVYTKEAAGKNFERIEIPMTKSAKHEAQIDIVKTSFDDYRIGVHTQRFYGDYSGGGFAPNISHEGYATRKDALKAALQLIYDRFRSDNKPEDKGIKLASGAVLAYAVEQGITLEEKEIKPEEAKPEFFQENPDDYNHHTLLGEELLTAEWTEADEQYPVNKAIIHGTPYHQARLREVLRSHLAKLPLGDQLAIVNQLRERFKERRDLETYEASTVTHGKKGEHRRAIAIGLYVDDIILDNDLFQDNGHPVMTWLLNLFNGGDTALEKDREQNSTELNPTSQEDLNRQIEKIMNKPATKRLVFTEEEKDLIRKYTDHAPERPSLLPEEIVKLVWKLAYKYGYQDGPVLDPVIGKGELFRYASKEIKITGYNHHSFASWAAKILYPFIKINDLPFELHFFDKHDNHLKDQHQPEYELAISYPPAGPFIGMFGGMDEKEWTHADQYAEYCMTRGLDLLKPGGLLIFLMPLSFMDGTSSKVKEAIAQKSELLDAFRFESIEADIVVLRKKQIL